MSTSTLIGGKWGVQDRFLKYFTLVHHVHHTQQPCVIFSWPDGTQWRNTNGAIFIPLQTVATIIIWYLLVLFIMFNLCFGVLAYPIFTSVSIIISIQTWVKKCGTYGFCHWRKIQVLRWVYALLGCWVNYDIGGNWEGTDCWFLRLLSNFLN